MEFRMANSIVRNEDTINQDEIATIAQEMNCPLPVVTLVYESAFAQLKAEARITDYLPVFAARRTRNALLARRP
jgi:hypothetical protein